MPNPSNKGEKRTAILNAALQLFAERGFHATNVPLIAERAGISVGTLYHYFDSKETLVNELYRKLKGEQITAFWEGYPDLATAEKQFRTYWQQGTAYALANPVAFNFLEMHNHESYLDEESKKLQARALLLEGRLYDAGRQQGAIKNMPNPVLSAFIGGALISLVKSAWGGQIELTPAVVEQAAARCWEAIRNKEKAQIPMNQFTLAGEMGRVTIGFEPNTDGRAVVAIESWNYRAEGKAWIPKEALTQFRDDLQRCYDTLKGEARLVNHPEHQNLDLVVTVDRRGNVEIRGTYRETLAEENELKFRIQTDQTYIESALAGLNEVLSK